MYVHYVWEGNLGFRPKEGTCILKVSRASHAYESHSRVRLGSGSNETNSSVCGSPRAGLARAFGGAWLAAGSLLARACVGGPEPVSRTRTATGTDNVSFVTFGYHV
jgi:hypothetical protein